MVKKLVKLELEARNTVPRNFQNAPNRGYNPQYKRPPLQILQKEIKEQQDQVPHPLYLEGQVDDSAEDAAYGVEDSDLAVSNDDQTEYLLHEEENAREVQDSGVDHYCKHCAYSMQPHLERRHDLRSSRKRTQSQEQEEEAPSQKELVPKKVTSKGKNLLSEPLLSKDQIPSSSKIVSPPNTESVSKEIKSQRKPPQIGLPLLLICKRNLRK